jgi:RNA-splicing ligase RtcB
MKINARDLLAAGWTEGPRLGAALRRARELDAAGLDRGPILAQLEQEFPSPTLLVPRASPTPLAEAVEAETAEEAANLAAARQRMEELLRMPVVRRGVLMPDTCPSGSAAATIPVGGAIAVENAIIPGAHSADICCSMFATFFNAGGLPAGELMDHLQNATHFGAGGRPRGQQFTAPVLDEPVWGNPFLSGLRSRAQDFLGTQGDGNHFAYLGRIQFTEAQRAALETAGHTGLAETIARHDGRFDVLVTHHGSRGLGADLYKRGQKAARAWCDRNTRDIPDAAVWLPADSPEGTAYWDALQYIARWTRTNHTVLHDAFLGRIRQRPLMQIGNEHNFVWKHNGVFLHGKGATPAWRDALGRPLPGLIPLNMAREILLVLGADNDPYLAFCPHGAGRNLSRTAILRPYRDADGALDPARVKAVLASVTEGLDVRWFNGTPDLSESPLGYKDAGKVKAQITRFGLATVAGEIQPQGCIMAGKAPEPHWLREKREKRAAQKSGRGEGTVSTQPI